MSVRPARIDTRSRGANRSRSIVAAKVSWRRRIDFWTLQASGPARPQRVLAQIFNVSDGDHTAYLLGWQILPYRGAGTYDFASGGNLLALRPPTSGRPLGYGKGTVTFVGNSHAGTVNAVVALKSAANLSVEAPGYA